jgi:ribosomal protein S18 acetylase RimI-like enzyme
MTAAAALDNPVWHALTGAHTRFALGRGKARHYPRDMAPFSAIAEATPAAYADLAADLPPHTEARLFRPENEPPPPDWETLSAQPILQMVYSGRELPSASELDDTIVGLGQADAPDMLALVDAAKPGPFALRTCELGTYVGVRDARDEVLVAMGGERLRLDGYVELSAIAVHPRARGCGLGGMIMAHLARVAISRGETPFLHVFPNNSALGLYRRLGFRTRTTLWILWHRPIEDRHSVAPSRHHENIPEDFKTGESLQLKNECHCN